MKLAGLLKVLAVTSATFQSQLMVNVPISICTAQLQARSALCFISLIKSLNFAGLLEYLTVTSLIIFWSLFKVNFPICICTAQLQAKSALCFNSLIKSLNLNFAGLLKYFAAHHASPNLKPKSFTRPIAVHTVLLAGAGAAGEQTADHGGSESGEADQSQLNLPASSQRQRPVA